MKKLPEYAETILKFMADESCKVGTKSNPVDSSTMYDKFKSELFDESLTAKANPSKTSAPLTKEQKDEIMLRRKNNQMLAQISKEKNPETSEFDPRELAMGVAHEMKHTDDPAQSERIAIDHLSKHPNYYSNLIKLEKSGALGNPKKRKSLFTEDEVIAVLQSHQYAMRANKIPSFIPPLETAFSLQPTGDKMTRKRRLRIALKSGRPVHISTGKDMTNADPEKFEQPSLDLSASDIAKVREYEIKLKAEIEKPAEQPKAPEPEKKTKGEKKPVIDKATAEQLKALEDKKAREVKINKMTPDQLVAQIQRNVGKAFSKKGSSQMNSEEKLQLYSSIVNMIKEYALINPEAAKSSEFRLVKAEYEMYVANLRDENGSVKGNPIPTVDQYLKKSLTEDYALMKKYQMPDDVKEHLVKNMRREFALYNKIVANPRKKPALTPAELLEIRRKQILKLRSLIESTEKSIIRLNKDYVKNSQMPGFSSSVLEGQKSAIDDYKKVLAEFRTKLAVFGDGEKPNVEADDSEFETGALNAGIEYELQFTSDPAIAKAKAKERMLAEKKAGEPVGKFYAEQKKDDQFDLLGQKNPTQKKFIEMERLYYREFIDSPLGNSLNSYGRHAKSKALKGELIESDSERRKFFDRIRNFISETADAIIRSTLLVRTVRSSKDQSELYGILKQLNKIERVRQPTLEKPLTEQEKVRREAEKTVLAELMMAYTTSRKIKMPKIADDMSADEIKDFIREEKERNMVFEHQELWRNDAANANLFDDEHLSGYEYDKPTGSKARKKKQRTLSDEEHTEKLREIETLRYRKLVICSVLFALIRPMFYYDVNDFWKLLDQYIAMFGIKEKNIYRTMAQYKSRNKVMQKIVDSASIRDAMPLKSDALNQNEEALNLLQSLLVMNRASKPIYND